jgi:hypothetical protein
MIKRTLFFAYGLVSYAFFLATFLYAIAFVGGFSCRRSRWPPAGPLAQSIADAALLTISRCSTV